MNLQVGIKAFLKNKEGKYLLVRRNPEKYKDVGAKWDIIGGRINPGQGLLENLTREIYEETKLALEGGPQLLCAQDILKADFHVVRLTYLGDTTGEPTLSEEHTDYGWYTVEEMKNLENLDSYTRKVIEAGLVL